MTRPLQLLAGCVVLAASLTGLGCGDDSGEPVGPTTTLRITKDFGKEAIASSTVPYAGHETLLSQLRYEHDAPTDSTFDRVFAIDGQRDRGEAKTNQTVWATNVNGVETDLLPRDYKLYPGDVVQWDLRSWYVTLDVRATVGAFPETFTRGVFGGRFPVTVRCEDARSDPCRTVKRALRQAGVPLDGSMPAATPRPPRNSPQRARVLVGTWRDLRRALWPRLIEYGAERSGVFARFTPDGRKLHVLDRDARRVRSEGAGTGLVAAMRPTEEDLMWIVAGVDDVGLRRAARALNRETLRDAFAVAVSSDGVQKLPLERR